MTTIMLTPWILSWHNRIIPAHLWVQCKVSLVWPWEGEKQHCQGNRPDNALPWEDQAKRNIPSVLWFQCNGNTHQRLADTRGLDKADGDAILAEHREIEHCKADSSKKEAMSCKELESVRWEEKLSAMFLRKPVCFAFRQSPFQRFSFPRDSASASTPSDWLRMLMIRLLEHLGRV